MRFIKIGDEQHVENLERGRKTLSFKIKYKNNFDNMRLQVEYQLQFWTSIPLA